MFVMYCLEVSFQKMHNLNRHFSVFLFLQAEIIITFEENIYTVFSLVYACAVAVCRRNIASFVQEKKLEIKFNFIYDGSSLFWI